MNNDEKWMKIAIEEALKAQKVNEVPVGAVLVKENKIIAKAHNQSILSNDASAHAEIQVIRKAGNRLKNYRLVGTSLYVTLEPCAMCFGAIMHSRIKRLIFSTHEPNSGVCGSALDLTKANCFNHSIDLISGVLQNESEKILKDFFISRR